MNSVIGLIEEATRRGIIAEAPLKIDIRISSGE
jgi:hypothetical protein